MASKRRIRRKQCGNKRRYPTSAAAMAEMQDVIRNGRKGGGWLNVYRCQFCRGYHFGHAPAHKEGV